MSATYARSTPSSCPSSPVVDPFHAISLAIRRLDAVRRWSRPNRPHRPKKRSARPAGSCSWAKRNSTTRPPLAWPHSSSPVIPAPKSPSPIGSKSVCGEPWHLLTRRGSPAARRPPGAPPQTSDATRGPKVGRTIRTVRQTLQLPLGPRLSNGPTEALNNLIKRIKRVGFGFRNFENYRSGRCSTPANRTGVSWPDRRPTSRRTPPESEEPLLRATPMPQPSWTDVDGEGRFVAFAAVITPSR